MTTRRKVLGLSLLAAVFVGGYLVGHKRGRLLSPQASLPKVESVESHHQTITKLAPNGGRPQSPRALTSDPSFPRAAIWAERESSGHQNALNRISEDGYEMAFIYAGASEIQITNILESLSRYIKMSMIQEQATLDAKRSKEAYERLLDATLSPEQLAQYKEFERVKSIKREASAFKDYLSETGKDIDHEKLERIMTEVGNAKAFSWLPAHGPYDPPFDPPVGGEGGAHYFRAHYDRLAAAAREATARLRGSLSEEELALVRSYFDQQLGSIEKEIEATRMTREQFLEEGRRLLRKAGQEP